MSAYRIGVTAAQPARRLEVADGSAAGPFQAAVDKLTKWIPGDVLAIYGPGVTLIDALHAGPSLIFLVIMIVLTPVFVLAVAFKAGPVTRAVYVSAGLATVAFLIWSLSVPLNGWQQLESVAAHRGYVAIGAGIVALLFCYLAEGIKSRLAD